MVLLCLAAWRSLIYTRCVILTVLSLATFSSMALTGPSAMPPKPTFFAFLVTGKNPPKATTEEIQDYQKKHIQNFQRLFGEGKLVTAGPMADPDKTKRGIVVLSVDKKEEIPALFTVDPYVAKGFMELQIHQLSVEFGKLNTDKIDPSGIVENRIVLFAATGGEIGRDAWKAHVRHWSDKAESCGLAFLGRLSGGKDLVGVGLMRGTNDAAIDAAISGDPLVQSGAIKATKMPQWLSKGVL